MFHVCCLFSYVKIAHPSAYGYDQHINQSIFSFSSHATKCLHHVPFVSLKGPFLLFCSRFVKFSMPNIPDFETLFSQVQLFISTCNGEHIRYATDTCKSRLSKRLTLRCLRSMSGILQVVVRVVQGSSCLEWSVYTDQSLCHTKLCSLFFFGASTLHSYSICERAAFSTDKL